MIVDDLVELSVIRVFERGVANKECIAILVNETTNMGQYGMMLGVAQGTNSAVPVYDQLFWFGDGVAQKGDWIFVYTGSGKPRTTRTTDNLSNIYTVFWGKPTTVLANSYIVPILFRVGAVEVGSPPVDRLQHGIETDA